MTVSREALAQVEVLPLLPLAALPSLPLCRYPLNSPVDIYEEEL